MSLQNKVHLIPYPENLGGNPPERHFLLSLRLPPFPTTAYVDLRNYRTRIEFFDPDASGVETFRV